MRIVNISIEYIKYELTERVKFKEKREKSISRELLITLVLLNSEKKIESVLKETIKDRVFYW